MRISDWSSDVCSSDLAAVERAEAGAGDVPHRVGGAAQLHESCVDLGNLGLRVGKRRARLCGHIIGGHQILRKAAVRDLVHLPKRSEEHTSELQSLMRISYAVFCLKKKKKIKQTRVYITLNQQR